MSYLFTSESVSEGHPDKIADQISDAILDHFLAGDPDSKVACEVLVTTGLVIISGEVKSKAHVDVQEVAREVIRNIGYTKSEYQFDASSCGIITTLHEQSPDINRGVENAEQGAGDQGMMFGYACNETDNFMPLTLELSHRILKELATIRHENKIMTYLRPDSKAQVTIEYEGNKPVAIKAIVVSTQHDEFGSDEEMQAKIKDDVINNLIPRVVDQMPENIGRLFNGEIEYHINPTGKFVIGGPHGDTGLTGRKIIVDTYGGKGAHGGGAFSGKDSSKVDRSAAYAARHIAKNLVAAGIADEALVQVAYAIGVAQPVGVNVNTFGSSHVNESDGEISRIMEDMFDLRPKAIVERFGLKEPKFLPSATYGHLGREPRTMHRSFRLNGTLVEKDVELFSWEKLDYINPIKEKFGL